VKKPTVEERRLEILGVTRDVLIERGFAHTRISDVANRLGVSTSLIHYHFDSKEELLAEAFRHAASQDLAEMEAEIDAADTAIGKLEALIQNSVPEGSDDVEWMLWIDAWGEALRHPELRSISQELDQRSLALIERVIEFGLDTGEFRCSLPHDAALRLTALIDGLAVQFAAHDDVLSRDQVIDHVRTLAAAEVGVDPSHLGAAVAAPPPSPTTGPATQLALRQLVDRYCDAVLRRDTAAWAATWTDDATWDLGGGALEGREAVVAAWEQAMAGFDWVVQAAPTLVLEVDEAAGTGTGRVTVEERFQRADGRRGILLGVYHDRYRRTADGWRFAARRLQVVDVVDHG
jgi:AcrR family transcriptional regulator